MKTSDPADVNFPDRRLLLFLGPGGPTPELILKGISKITRQVSVIYFTGFGNSNSTLAKALWDESFFGDWIECRRLDLILNEARNLNHKRSFDGVLTFTEFMLSFQAEAAEEFGLAGPGKSSIKICQSKLLQREMLKANGFNCPRFGAVRTLDDLFQTAEHVGFPSVLKPSFGAASFQVKKIANMQELLDAFIEGKKRYRDCPVPYDEELFVLEEYLEGERNKTDSRLGDYVSIETLTQKGKPFHIGVLDKLKIRHGFIEEGDVFPPHLSDEEEEQIKAYASDIIKAVGIQCGASHMEIKLTPSGPVLLEINGRVGGATTVILNEATDFSFVAEATKVALGLRHSKEYRVRQSVCFRSIPFPENPARLVAQTSHREVMDRVPELSFLRYRFAVGDRLDSSLPGIASSGVLCTYLVKGENLDNCLENSERVQKMIGTQTIGIAKDSQGKDSQQHVLFLDRLGFHKYCDSNGEPYLNPEQYVISLISTPTTVHQITPQTEIVLLADLTNAERIRKAVAAIHAIRPIDFVFTCSEAFIELAADLRAELKIPGRQPQEAMLVRDKIHMKEALAASKVKVPEFYLASLENMNHLLSKYMQIVVKPIRGSGSNELYFINTKDQAATLAEQLGPRLKSFEAEEFIPGQFLHVDAVIRKNKIQSLLATEYLTPTHGFKNGHPFRAIELTDPQLVQNVWSFTSDVIKGLKIQNSVIHLECFIRDNGEIIFCEVAGRAGGNAVIPYFQAKTGLNLFEVMLKIEVGQPTKEANYAKSTHGYVSFPPKPGIITEISKTSDFLMTEIVCEEILLTKGQRVNKPKYSGEIAAYFVVAANTSTNLIKQFKEIEDRFVLQTSPYMPIEEKTQISPDQYMREMHGAFADRYRLGRDSWSNEGTSATTVHALVSELGKGTGQWVLDIGCGIGQEAEILCREGFNVIGIDLVASDNWKILEAKYPDRIHFFEDDFLRWSPKRRFDAIIDNGCFHHQHPAMCEPYLSKIMDLIEPSGFLALSLFAQPQEDCKPSGSLFLLADGRFSKEFSEAEISQLLQKSKLEPRRLSRIRRPLYKFENLLVIAQKESTTLPAIEKPQLHKSDLHNQERQ